MNCQIQCSVSDPSLQQCCVFPVGRVDFSLDLGAVSPASQAASFSLRWCLLKLPFPISYIFFRMTYQNKKLMLDLIRWAVIGWTVYQFGFLISLLLFQVKPFMISTLPVTMVTTWFYSVPLIELSSGAMDQSLRITHQLLLFSKDQKVDRSTERLLEKPVSTFIGNIVLV